MSMKLFFFYIFKYVICIKCNYFAVIVIKTYSHRLNFKVLYKINQKFFMKNQEKTTSKTVVNVGYCESTSEWLDRVMTELADENKNFVDLSVMCA